MVTTGKTVRHTGGKKTLAPRAGKGAARAAKAGEAAEGGTGAQAARPRTGTWQTYVYRVFKSVTRTIEEEEDGGGGSYSMKRHTAQIYDSVVNDMLDRIGQEAAELSKATRSRTLRVNDVAAAIKLVTRNTEVSRVMLQAGTEALAKYRSSLPPREE